MRTPELNTLPAWAKVGLSMATATLLLFASTVRSQSVENCIAAPPALVGWWSAENSTTDSVGTNAAALLNGASFEAGYVGMAFSLNGNGAVVEVPNSASLNFDRTAAMTIELWACRTSTATTYHIIGKRVGLSVVDINYEIACDPAYGLQFNSGTGIGAMSGVQLPVGVWTHVAGTFEAGTYSLYVNGELVARAAGLTLGPTNTAPLKIGGAGDGQVFGGFLDEISIYNRALTSVEIAKIYEAGKGGKCMGPIITAQPRNQVGYWGQTATLTVGANGKPPLLYQWSKDNKPIIGATGSSLTLTNLQMQDAGFYSVVVSNADGTVTSRDAYLTMNTAGVSLAAYAGVTIEGVPGLTYGIQYTTNVNDTNSWKGAVNLTLNAPTALWFDVHPAMQPQRFYRVVPGPISIP